MKISLAFSLLSLFALAPDAAASHAKGPPKKQVALHHWQDVPSLSAHHACPPPPACPPRSVWVPGHHESRCEKVWVAGCEQRVWVEPAFEWRHPSCGTSFSFGFGGGHWKTVCTPGHYEMRTVQVWVPGQWRPGC